MSLALSPTVAAVNDLMFASRIRAAAQQSGSQVVFVRSAADLLEQAATARRLLVDLEARWLNAPETIAAVKAARPDVEIVAFASHVLGELLQAAQAAGADRVLARSAFVKALPDLLRG